MLTKINVRNTEFSITQHWTAEELDEMTVEFERIERNYPTPGYGTSLYDVRLDPTGLLWHGTFYRSKSCD